VAAPQEDCISAAEEFLINAYKNMDAMKEQIKARYAEINGCARSTGELQRQCWDVWRLATFYLHALDSLNGDADEPHHAPYTPPEFAGERAERIQAMDARLQEVLGDAVEAEEDDEDEEEDDAPFDF
jgi:hypothetical protein